MKDLYYLLRFNLFLVISIAFLLVSCAPQAQIDMLDRNVSGLQIETHQLEQKVNALQKRIDSLESQQGKKGHTTLARLNARVDSLESELMRLNGLIEQLKYEQERQSQDIRLLEEKVFGRSYRPTDQNLSSFGRSNGQNVTKENKIKTENLSESSESNIPVEEEKTQIDETTTSHEKVDLYQQAMSAFKDKDYQEAKRLFKEFIKMNPGDPKVANAHFWIGECEYKMSRFEEAILEYNKVISDFPNSNKVPDAMLKQGFAFIKLGDKETAKILLKKLTRKYPGTSQAKAAKRQLRLLK